MKPDKDIFLTHFPSPWYNDCDDIQKRDGYWTFRLTSPKSGSRSWFRFLDGDIITHDGSRLVRVERNPEAINGLV